MAKLQKVEKLVEKVLRGKIGTRDDDFCLIFNVYREINPDTVYMDFRRVMRDHAELGLPSFESITRARRKLQSEKPELGSSRKAKGIRKTEELDFKRYALGGFKDLPF